MIENDLWVTTQSLALSQGSEHVLADGLHVLVRPLVAADRDGARRGLPTAVVALASHAVLLATGGAGRGRPRLPHPARLRRPLHARRICLDEAGRPGIGVARYVRESDRPSHAEVAVTVVDAYQRRGLGTLLMRLLAWIAVTHGVRTFVYYAQWQNEEMIDELRRRKARGSRQTRPAWRASSSTWPAKVTNCVSGRSARSQRTLAQRLRDVFERVQSSAGHAR